MDKIEALGSSIAQISLYDLKSYYNQAKAVVLNYTEMEAKVRDATNDDPWGASSTLMQEIAQGTFNFQQFNEIMPTIYKRFTEKEAREWRQIYKALQLLEYLIKHGSERVIDDARSHISMIKILRNFHYVDDKGKDQGINVRNRAKEISELLSDLDRVRQERRKAKAAKNKYVGVGSDGPSFSNPSGSKYGGFGSDSLGYSGGSGGGGDEWHGGGASSSRDHYSSRNSFKQNDDFEEYDAGEWEDRPAAGSSAHRSAQSNKRSSISSVRKPSISVSMKKPADKVTAPPPKAKEVDLFSMGEDDDFVSAPPPSSTTTAAKTASVSLDDDFDDFQSAPAAPTSSFATNSQPAGSSSSAAPKPNVFELLNATSPVATTSRAAPGSGVFGAPMNSFASQSAMSAMSAPPANTNMFNSSMTQPVSSVAGANSMAGVGNMNRGVTSSSTSKASGGDQFDDLFSFAGLTTKKSGATSNSTGVNGKPAGQATLSMAAMAREQSSASIWGPSGGSGASAQPVGMGVGIGGSSIISSAPLGSNGGASMGNHDHDDLLL